MVTYNPLLLTPQTPTPIPLSHVNLSFLVKQNVVNFLSLSKLSKWIEQQVDKKRRAGAEWENRDEVINRKKIGENNMYFSCSIINEK